jgi:shikimate dehydrogenase
VTYDLLVPKSRGLEFDAVFDGARIDGYRGLNITYPYKEIVVSRLSEKDNSVRLIGSSNTVLFDCSGPAGANTDFTGFLSAYRNTFGKADPGIVALAGCGGVGRAIGHALAQLGAKALHLFDANRQKAEALAGSLSAKWPSSTVDVADSIYEACESADGLVNCTPLGMVGRDGSAFPSELIAGHTWAFDAVYTPVETVFLRNARAAGLSLMSGYELFIGQGVDAFRLFTGHDIDCRAIRSVLQSERPG